MQTLHVGCSKAELKKICPTTDPFPGACDGQNLISWRWSLPSPTDPVLWGSIHAIPSYHGNRPTKKHTNRQGRLQYTALQLARSVTSSEIHRLSLSTVSDCVLCCSDEAAEVAEPVAVVLLLSLLHNATSDPELIDVLLRILLKVQHIFDNNNSSNNTPFVRCWLQYNLYDPVPLSVKWTVIHCQQIYRNVNYCYTEIISIFDTVGNFSESWTEACRSMNISLNWIQVE